MGFCSVKIEKTINLGKQRQLKYIEKPPDYRVDYFTL